MPDKPTIFKTPEEMRFITNFMSSVIKFEEEFQKGELSEAAQTQIKAGLEKMRSGLESMGIDVIFPEHWEWWEQLKKTFNKLLGYAKTAGYYIALALFVIAFIMVFLLFTTNSALHEFIKTTSEIFYESLKLFYKTIYAIARGVLTISPKEMFLDLKKIQDDYLTKVQKVLDDIKRTHGVPQGVFFLFLGVTNMAFLYAYIYARTHI